MVLKVKFQGSKRTIKILSSDDIIQEGDFACKELSHTKGTDTPIDQIETMLKNKRYFQTMCAGDSVSQHENISGTRNQLCRLYFRVLPFGTYFGT